MAWGGSKRIPSPCELRQEAGARGRAWQADWSLLSPPSTLCPALIYLLLCPQALSTPGWFGAQWCAPGACARPGPPH